VVPARPRKPRDKAAVEGNIGIIQRGFFQEVRNRNFYSLVELNTALREYLSRLNINVMKEYGISRTERFQKEKSLLKPLATTNFELSEWRQAKVHPDCHIQIQRSFYSVPYTYVGHTVRVKIGSRLVEIFDSQNQSLLATHTKCNEKFNTSTNESHYPEPKVSVTKFEIKYAKNEADKIGPNTKALVDKLFEGPYPLKHLRRVQGILRLGLKKTVSNEALEHATKMALTFNKLTFGYVQSTALHFEHHGKRPVIVTPKRDQNEIYLHNNHNDLKTQTGGSLNE